MKTTVLRDTADRDLLEHIATLRRDLVKVAEACGVEHPGLIGTDAVEVLDGRTASTPLDEVYGYQPGWGVPSQEDQDELARLMEAHSEPEAATEGPPETSHG